MNRIRNLIFPLILFHLAVIAPARDDAPIFFKSLRSENNLSQVSILFIAQDADGFMWFGTYDGINRYDGYRYTIFRHNENDPRSFSGNEATTAFLDSQGDFWIGTASKGLNRFIKEDQAFEHFTLRADSETGVGDSRINQILEDYNHRMWIATDDGLVLFDKNNGSGSMFLSGRQANQAVLKIQCLLEKEPKSDGLWLGTNDGLFSFDPSTKTLARAGTQNNDRVPPYRAVQTLFRDSKGVLWLGTDTALIRYIPENDLFDADIPTLPNPKEGLGVTCILEEPDQTLWFGTTGQGLLRLNAARDKIQHYTHQQGQHGSLSDSHIRSLYQDKSGLMWAGTFSGGPNIFDKNAQYFQNFAHDEKKPNTSLANDVVMGIHEDKDGDIWVGTHLGGLNRLNPEQGTFEHFRADPKNPQTLSNDSVWSIDSDKDGLLWLATYGGGLNLFDKKTGKFRQFRYAPNDPNSLGTDNLFVVLIDSDNTPWAGSNDSGLLRFNRQDETFTQFRNVPGKPSSISNDRVLSIFEDRDGGIWLGTNGGGLNFFNRATETFTHLRYDKENPYSLSSDMVIALCQDEEDNLWVGTQAGLNRLYIEKSASEARFERITERDGLANNLIYGILTDDYGNLWVSTNAGISRIELGTRAIRNFGFEDGLSGKEFNGNACLKDNTGKLYFGGITGLYRFTPKKPEVNAYNAPIAVTSFKVFNELRRLSPPGGQTHLSHMDTAFSFEFSLLDFRASGKNRYAYKMEGLMGLEESWINLGAKHDTSFTNLDPGDYTFRVRAKAGYGDWNPHELALNIRIVPPMWRTWWAYTLYVLALLGLIAFYVTRSRKRLIYERSMNDRLRQLDRLKDSFLANTSHELRTPLNGMIGIAEALMEGVAGPVTGKARANLSMIVSCGRRLSHLVNDILDFSKLKSHELDLRFNSVDMRALTDVVLTLSFPLLGDKKVELINEIGPELPPAHGDENRLQQVLHNLVGNAVKFTDEGQVVVSGEHKDGMLFISVSDTGHGIPVDAIHTIFDSFTQAYDANSRTHGGTGLGLSITKQLVSLHKGEIWLESSSEKGSVFTFTVPISHEKPSNSAARGTVSRLLGMRMLDSLEMELPQNLQTPHDPLAEGNFNIMIVDDEPVNLQVLSNYLSLEHYKITLATNGPQAIDMLLREKYDLVLLDIMMPKMSGYDVCREIRKKFSVHELPVIFMTARSMVDDLVTGFSIGANDYLVKPITKGELTARVHLHLELQDINHTLEQKVSERTKELESRNQEILQTQERLIMKEKMAALGTLTSGIAHEINTPVGNSVTAASHLSEKTRIFENSYRQEELTEEEMERYIQITHNTLEILMNNLRRAAELISSFKKVAVDQASEVKRAFNMADYLREVLVSLELEIRKRRHNTKISVPEDLVIDSYPGAFAQIVTNFVMNSLLHGYEMGETGTLSIDIAKKDGVIEMIYADDGKGMSPEIQTKIFDPFFTTKRGTGGSGLGLHLVYNLVVRTLKGSITCQSEPGKGVTLIVRFPV